MERMYSAESAIEQNASDISLKVSTTDYTGTKVASLINQSADTIKIQANHVEIDGTTTFGSNSTVADYMNNAIDTAVDNIDIGGRNLVLSSSTAKSKTGTNSA